MPGKAGGGERHKALLIVSLILLVMNSAATALTCRPSAGIPLPNPSSPPPTLPDDLPGSAREAPSAPEGPGMSARQKYLLGKRIDVNIASWREIAELPGISDAVAWSVVRTRERIGGFRSPADLLAVRGIKRKRLKKILPFLAKMGNK